MKDSKQFSLVQHLMQSCKNNPMPSNQYKIDLNTSKVDKITFNDRAKV